MAIILKTNKVNLFVSSVLFVFWYHSLNFLDTPHINILLNIPYVCILINHQISHRIGTSIDDRFGGLLLWLLQGVPLRRIHTCHAMPFPCHSVKGLDCVFSIWFTQCGRVWFTHAMPFPCHATNMPFWKWPLKVTAGSWQGNGMLCVWISMSHPETACGQPSCVWHCWRMAE
jgi:hypothetical protein